MRKLISIFRKCGDIALELRVYENTKKMRGEVRNYKDNESVSSADFFGKDANEYRIKEYFGFANTCCYKVPFEKKNGRVVLYPINKKRRVIWTNEDYDEWCEEMKVEITEEEITPEYYAFCCENNLDDERMNLDIDVDGYIVAFADLGLWNGRYNGSKLVGDNVKDILSSDCDYCTWYCDEHNVRLDAKHHDGTNHILYRVAKDKQHARHLMDMIIGDRMNEEQFRRATKSLRPYVAKVYGF